VPEQSGETGDLAALRAEVRRFVAEQKAAGTITPAVDSWLSGWDEGFSRALAARGWLGMTVPAEYGGHGLSFRERFAVTEELLAAGAPVSAHWIADRQIVPSLLKYGTEQQKQAYLPKIARGECYFGIGMSEPDSGSDLASVRTKATKDAGGWTIEGTKVWTSGAHRADAFICLARTEPADPKNRHAGLSQFIVDLRSPGVEIRPIISMGGAHHFNEVHLSGVHVGDDMVFGEIGDGWAQVTSELGFERSGPERFLSAFPLLAEAAEQAARGTLPKSADLGRLVARIAGLHQMSAAVAGALERKEPADTAAAVVKVLGTTTEGDIADFADLLAEPGDPATAELRRLADQAVLQRPGFTLRGGTNEVLRGVIARGLGLR
jgi:alkylation response protein AidB-like acyl-CoA dehydrogenase